MPDVASCSVSPSSIAIGGQSNLIVTLTSPAPQGGLTVNIDVNSDGNADTLEYTPQSVGVEEGHSQSNFLLQTEAVDGAATQITFSAQIGNGAIKAATLTIS